MKRKNYENNDIESSMNLYYIFDNFIGTDNYENDNEQINPLDPPRKKVNDTTTTIATNQPKKPIVNVGVSNQLDEPFANTHSITASFDSSSTLHFNVPKRDTPKWNDKLALNIAAGNIHLTLFLYSHSIRH
jgi:hypothetical protein